MIELLFELLAALVPDMLDDWLQAKLDRIKSKPLRRLLRVLSWLVCALLEIAIAIGLLSGLIWLAWRLGYWILDLIEII